MPWKYRERKDLNLDLPIGSNEGSYDLALLNRVEMRFSVQGARLSSKITSWYSVPTSISPASLRVLFPRFAPTWAGVEPISDSRHLNQIETSHQSR